MDQQERNIRIKLRDDFVHYAHKCLKVRSKSGNIIPFHLNNIQHYIHDKVEHQRLSTGKVRAVILKGRQQGCTTYIQGRFYWRVTHHFGMRAFILTHDINSTNNLFDMAQRFHEHCPFPVRPTIEASNSKELIFSGLDSGYKLGTAGNKAVGRSSTIQLLHGSEVGYWPNASEHSKGIFQAVPGESNTEIFIESTANGEGNYFHELWQLAESKSSDFIPIFIPWYWQEEYKKDINEPLKYTEEEELLVKLYNLKDSQLAWRRNKIQELSIGGINGIRAFMQEYPCSAIEAFQTTGDDKFINSGVVQLARNTIVEPYGPLIIGVDIGCFSDRTSIIRRRGRLAYNLVSYSKISPMEVVGKLHTILIEEKPEKMCIDVGVHGYSIIDRLKELGHGNVIYAVNFGLPALNDERYANIRAELWALTKEWLLDYPCQIPNVDSLHADLCSIKYKEDNKSRLLMEKKEDMKARGVRSPDEADALILTFAYPNPLNHQNKQKEYNHIISNLMGDVRRVDNLRKNAYK